MERFQTIEDMRAWSREQKAAGQRVSFVPTMGALHEGHLSLLREGKKRGDALVLSIYVNPTQFSPNEDLDNYPRDLEGDIEKAKSCGTDAVFFPSNEIMYPQGYQTYVDVLEVTQNLCGSSRETHFRGVTTVVAKLFNIAEPDIALFGEKDYQQLATIKRMIKDLDMPIEIVGCPIVREEDGIAMSSRNVYLSSEERIAARSLNKSLKIASDLIDTGETDARKIIGVVRKAIEDSKLARIDYVKLVDANTLEDIQKVDKSALLALAVFFAKTRLIDNRVFLRT